MSMKTYPLLLSHRLRVDGSGMTVLDLRALGAGEFSVAIPPVTIRKMGRELREISDLPQVNRVVETRWEPTRHQTPQDSPEAFRIGHSPGQVMLTATSLQGVILEMPISPQRAEQLAQGLLAAAQAAMGQD